MSRHLSARAQKKSREKRRAKEKQTFAENEGASAGLILQQHPICTRTWILQCTGGEGGGGGDPKLRQACFDLNTKNTEWGLKKRTKRNRGNMGLAYGRDRASNANYTQRLRFQTTELSSSGMDSAARGMTILEKTTRSQYKFLCGRSSKDFWSTRVEASLYLCDMMRRTGSSISGTMVRSAHACMSCGPSF